jgi:CheY-like chemotaxis protein
MARKWVLVVDDDPAILTIVADALEHPELSVTTAGDALQAFIQARELKPIAIVADIQMPVYGDGSTILQRLREDPSIPPVPIIFMTGMELSRARQLLPVNDPMIGLMPKPLNLDRVRDYIWRLAGIAPPDPPLSGTR